MIRDEQHVGDRLRLRLLHQRILVGAFAGEHEEDARVTGLLGGFEDGIQTLRHAMRARIQEDLLLAEIEAPYQLDVRQPGLEDARFNAVGEKDQLVARDSTRGQPLEHAGRDDADPGRPPVEQQLEPLRHLNRGSVRERAQLHRRLRPDVADVEDERRALDPGVHKRRQPDEQRWRLDEDDIHRAELAQRGQARERERKMVEEAA